jgi:hypothetical protein
MKSVRAPPNQAQQPKSKTQTREKKATVGNANLDSRQEWEMMSQRRKKRKLSSAPQDAGAGKLKCRPEMPNIVEFNWDKTKGIEGEKISIKNREAVKSAGPFDFCKQ